MEKSQTGNENVNDITGNYVSDSYSLRNEGYDWVSVSVKRNSADEIFISVRSRADKKKPTCTFDTKAYKSSDSTYIAVEEGKNIEIQFHSNTVEIKTEKPEDEAVLYFYCSGGATVAGTYLKIYESLDSVQIDQTTFSKVQRLQDVGFHVSAKPVGNQQELEIYPFGLSLTNQTTKHLVDGKIVDAEVEDLDSDGFPEVLVYTESPDKKGNVIGISVNNEKTVSYITFPSINENQEIRKGYKGEDEFTIIETSLARQFPIFENGIKSGKTRQIQYKMESDGKAKKFVVKNITDF